MQNVTGYTQDTNIQHMHDETLILPLHEHLQLHASQYKQKTQHPSHLLHKHTTYFNTTRLKTSLTTATRQQTFPQTSTHSLQETYKQTCAIYIHILSLGILPQEAITKYCAQLHHTLAALKRYFTAPAVTPFAQLRTNKSPLLKSYLQSTPNHIHHHYSPRCNTHTHTTHVISSTAPTYAPHCHPGFVEDPAGVTALLARWTEKLAGGPQAGRSDSPPLERVMGVG